MFRYCKLIQRFPRIFEADVKTSTQTEIEEELNDNVQDLLGELKYCRMATESTVKFFMAAEFNNVPEKDKEKFNQETEIVLDKIKTLFDELKLQFSKFPETASQHCGKIIDKYCRND